MQIMFDVQGLHTLITEPPILNEHRPVAALEAKAVVGVVFALFRIHYPAKCLLGAGWMVAGHRCWAQPDPRYQR